MVLRYCFIPLLVFSIKSCAEQVQNATVNCTAVRNKFGDYNSDFTQCALYYSRPITLCEKCVEKYLNLMESHRNLTFFKDGNGPCINSFVDKDRLQVLNTLYDNSETLWSRAKCYECFDVQNNTLTSNKSKETIRFRELHDNLMICLNKSSVNETTMCPLCMDSYVELNDYYNSISNENEKIGVCMDIVDQMNTTRSFWSNNCCKFRRHPEYIFLGTTFFSFVIAALFYLLTKVCTDKRVAAVLPQTRFAGSFSNHER